MNRAFTAREQAAILETDVDNGPSQGYSYWHTGGGKNTRDKIFLLSYAEASRYFGVQYAEKIKESRVAPTAYAKKRGAYTNRDSKSGWWWLRSPGNGQSVAAGVSSGGSLSYFNVDRSSVCVRPALWVNLESGIFRSFIFHTLGRV